VSVVTLSDLIEALSRGTSGTQPVTEEQLRALNAYRARYGAR
jgi:hypothetical protein